MPYSRKSTENSSREDKFATCSNSRIDRFFDKITKRLFPDQEFKFASKMNMESSYLDKLKKEGSAFGKLVLFDKVLERIKIEKPHLNLTGTRTRGHIKCIVKDKSIYFLTMDGCKALTTWHREIVKKVSPFTYDWTCFKIMLEEGFHWVDFFKFLLVAEVLTFACVYGATHSF